MFKALKLALELFALALLLSSILMMVVIFCETSNLVIPTPTRYLIETLLIPIVRWEASVFNIPFNTLDKTTHFPLGIFSTVLMFLFVIAMGIASGLGRLDHNLHGFSTSLKASLKRKAQAKIEAILGLNKPQLITEIATLVVIQIDFLADYPALQKPFKQDFLNPNQKSLVFGSEERFILRFDNLQHALEQLLAFSQHFDQWVSQTPLLLEKMPVYRIAMQSLETQHAMFDQENFLWALLGCVGPNEILMGETARNVYQEQQLTAKLPVLTRVMEAGTFTNLGRHRTADAYRLEKITKPTSL